MSTSGDKPVRATRVWFSKAAGRTWIMVELADGRAVGLAGAAATVSSGARPKRSSSTMKPPPME